MTAIEKAYASVSTGQVHVYRSTNQSERTLVCLHPAPYSGLYFTTLMPLLERACIAPDYPGYGGSTPPDFEPQIADYAETMLETLDALDIVGRVDILGFHSGCLVGAEMALRTPDRVGKLILCNVPFFDQATQATLRKTLSQQIKLTTSLDSLEKSWDLAIRRRADGMGLERAFANYVEHLRSVPRDHLAFMAAFDYDCSGRFGRLDADVTVIATAGALREATLDAAAAINDSGLIEADDVGTGVFESGAERMAEILDSLLDRP
jgi:pimeloyl-ACP methyl ester carboxylesterase